jgi:hypothetical protein
MSRIAGVPGREVEGTSGGHAYGVKLLPMTTKPDRRSTGQAMRDTAEALERSEALLHDSAERSPDDATSLRLDRLADEVTRQAKRIDRRADAVAASDPQRDADDSAARQRGA